MFAIKVENLTKEFDGLIAVDNVSFDIGAGEIFGLLGPNGAGKTTILSMLSTILKPTSGTAVVNGMDILKDEDGVRKSIGIVFQDPSLDEELTAYENMDFHGRLYRIPKNLRQERIEELLKLVELEDRKDGLVKTFSGGMRRRLEIARGLLHHPKVLFLDEPTLGLDPQTRNRLWQYIEDLNKEKGITIIITTHYMDEADRLCDRVAIIDMGKIIALDTPHKLKEDLGGDVITIKSPDADKIYSKIKVSWVKHIESNDGFVTINLENAEKHITEIVNLSSRNDIDIESLSIHKPTLEDVFLNFTGKTIRDQEVNGREHMLMRRRLWRRR
ncbi:MAG: ATP-binding cassette domain-containing protein [Methanocellales archaeon]|nr:ATP-binding cassette domain-containing protein [Methanocellales archaeon]MDD3291537.1 ATP-binding cassette domain-containing protein [Methanocellales archaeon]MDD5235927.1 ATP-binding cassette domain-containing protein [Methanocellales archaeon]MDD5485319.1 ATP-binding cassette domain-containing protein [Methanocellales archaeon]